MPSIDLREPLPPHVPILNSDARFKVACCGRRFGKTEGIGGWAVTFGHGPILANGLPMFPGGLRGKRIWWVTRTAELANLIIWPWLKATLNGAWTHKVENLRQLMFQGGGEISVRSGDEPDSLRGPGLDGLVIDEAAHQSEEVWQVLRPALSDRRGWAIFISTPSYKRNGKWFKRLFLDAQSRPGWESWRYPTSANPIIYPDEIEEARQTIAPLLFRQEYLAEFIDTEGAIFKADWFRYYREMEGGFAFDLDGGKTVGVDQGFRFGTVDLAASLKVTADYTVIGSCHASPDRDLLLLDLDRRRLSGPDQVPAIRRAVTSNRLGTVWIERTGYQLALVQAAVADGLPVRELIADRDKFSRSLPLQARMAAGTVYFREGAPWVPNLEAELLSFTGEPDGATRPGALEDGRRPDAEYHDDQVDVLAYAAQVVGGDRAPTVRRLSRPVLRPVQPMRGGVSRF